jgi:hypothetical protein
MAALILAATAGKPAETADRYRRFLELGRELQMRSCEDH